MGVSKPYRRTCRPFLGGAYGPGNVTYIRHPKFATTPPVQYVRAFEILQKDILELFEYIEPSDSNLRTYSYRIHELLMRVCIEVETNFKAILFDNSYAEKKNLDMQDYRKINATHRLSSFTVRLPVWQGKRNIRRPYVSWARHNSRHISSPSWYQAYNNSKHSRHVNFEQANFLNLTDATSGLVALLSSQFHDCDFSSTDFVTGQKGRIDGFEKAIGGYFLVKFPGDWPKSKRYDFDWDLLKGQPDPFQNLTF
jgi:hypothetical protein